MYKNYFYSFITLPFIALGTLLSSISFADDTDQGFWAIYGELGIENGGDQVVSVKYQNGYVEDLKTGDGFVIGLGGVYYLPGASFQVSIGYKADSFEARDSESYELGSFSFERILINALAFHHYQRHAFGAGLTHQQNIKFDLDFNNGTTFDADDANGFLAEYRYYFTDNLHFGIRYTDIDYKIKGSEGQKSELSGNAFGLYLGASF